MNFAFPAGPLCHPWRFRVMLWADMPQPQTCRLWQQTLLVVLDHNSPSDPTLHLLEHLHLHLMPAQQPPPMLVRVNHKGAQILKAACPLLESPHWAMQEELSLSAVQITNLFRGPFCRMRDRQFCRGRSVGV